MSDFDFTGKTVLVTGASSGIGKETAKALAAAGAELMITSRRENELVKIKNEFPGVKISVCPGDITDESFSSNLIDKTINTFGKLDILINSAGIIESGSIENTSLKDWDYMMNINVRSVFLLCQAATQYLLKTRGNIVNVSSVTGIRSFPGILAYCTSKAAVDQFTRCAALDLAPKGVRVNAVNPGVTITNLHRAGGMDEPAYANFLEHSKTTHPLGRAGDAKEIAGLIMFLASEKAGWITGETVSIDGGRHLTCAR